VFTGDRRGAGTSANVTLQLYGENGDSGSRVCLLLLLLLLLFEIMFKTFFFFCSDWIRKMDLIVVLLVNLMKK
jgi:hypothetical protein